jgi:bifunctional non-homologous end joining protein LigD
MLNADPRAVDLPVQELQHRYDAAVCAGGALAPHAASDERLCGSLELLAQNAATLIVFDVLHLDGRAVRVLPYHRRRKLLERTLPATGRCWRIPAPLDGALDAVLEVTRAHQLEGIVAKRLDAPYEPGRRGGAWLKHKHRRLETFAVTGWRPASPNARRPDAIFVSRATPDGLRPAGTAELGLTGDQRDQLRTALNEHHLETHKGAHRVAPGIYLDVDFHGSRSGPLRDAVMRTVRVEG